MPLANEPTRRHSVTAPAQPVQLCRGHGVVTRATRSRRCAQARRHQSSTSCSASCVSRFFPKAIKNCASPRKLLPSNPARSLSVASLFGSCLRLCVALNCVASALQYLSAAAAQQQKGRAVADAAAVQEQRQHRQQRQSSSSSCSSGRTDVSNKQQANLKKQCD